MKKSEFAGAFTLIELLVVITIIAVLSSLLLPALVAAKNRAKAAQCVAKEKQLGSAFTSYLTDNHGFYPYIYPSCGVDNAPNGAPYSCTNGPDRYMTGCNNGCGGGAYCYNSSGWNLVLAPYFGYGTNYFAAWSFRSFCGQGGPPCSACNFDPNIQRTVVAYGQQVACPANPWPIPVYCTAGYVSAPGIASWVQPIWRMLASSYTMNGSMFPVDFRSGGVCTNASGWYKRANLSDISNPAGLALVGEMPWDVFTPSSPANVWTAGTLPIGSGGGGMQAGQVSGIALANQWFKPTPTTLCNGYLAAWHGGCMNVLYNDGHVDRVSQTTLSNSAAQFSAGLTTSAGGIFWGDGKSSGWYNNQFPGYSYPN